MVFGGMVLSHPEGFETWAYAYASSRKDLREWCASSGSLVARGSRVITCSNPTQYELSSNCTSFQNNTVGGRLFFLLSTTSFVTELIHETAETWLLCRLGKKIVRIRTSEELKSALMGDIISIHTPKSSGIEGFG